MVTSKNMSLSSVLRAFLFCSVVLSCSGCLVLEEGYIKAQKVVNNSKRKENAAAVKRSASLDSLATAGQVAVGMTAAQVSRAYGKPDWRSNVSLPDGMGKITSWTYKGDKWKTVVIVNGYVSEIVDIVETIETVELAKNKIK